MNKNRKKWIPKGEYCYTIEKLVKAPDGSTYLQIKRCPFYRFEENGIVVCKYMGFRGYDACLGDQVKICGCHEYPDKYYM